MRVWVLWLVVALLAGCSAGTPPEARFPDVETRFAGTSDEAFDQKEALHLAAGPHTIKMSVSSKEGFAARLQAPDERNRYSGLYGPGSHTSIPHSGWVEIAELHALTLPGKAGDWELRFGCGDACRYAVAVEEGNTIPDARGRSISGDVTGTFDYGRDTYEIPVAHEAPIIRMDLYSDDRMTIDFDDGAGDNAWGMDLPAILAAGWQFAIGDGWTPGDWEVTVGCDGHCEFAISID